MSILGMLDFYGAGKQFMIVTYECNQIGIKCHNIMIMKFYMERLHQGDQKFWKKSPNFSKSSPKSL
jgi:hypothetical protein